MTLPVGAGRLAFSATVVVALAALHSPARATAAAPSTRRYRSVLHVGDSMVGVRHGLTKALAWRFHEEGARLRSDAWNGVGIERYARSGRLTTLVQESAPDLVIVTLGTNDVFVPHPEALAVHVRAIVRMAGGHDCIWMGPPTWKGDTGVVQIIRENAAPCAFFDSSDLPLERIKDGIHLTDLGGEQWAQAFWAFFRGAPDGGAAAGRSPSP